MNTTTINRTLAKIDKLYTVRFIGAEEEAVDDELQILFAGQETRWSIQVGCQYYCVNEYEYKDGELDAVTDHGTFNTVMAAVRTLCEHLQREKNAISAN